MGETAADPSSPMTMVATGRPPTNGVPESRPGSELWSAVAADVHLAVPTSPATEGSRTRSAPMDDGRAALVAEVVRALSSPGGRVLLIGEPGVGRSTVLTEVDRRAEEAAARVLRGHPLSAVEPFSGLVDLFAEVDFAELDVLTVSQRRMLESLRSSGPPPVDTPDRMALCLAVASAVRGLLRRGPVVISIDDWTHVDAQSADVLRYLVTRARPGQSPSLVATQVVDARLSGRQPAIDRAIFPPGTVHVVPPLSLQELAGVLAKWSGERLPPDQVAAVYRAAGGNPSWAMELLDRPLGRLQAPDSGPELPNSVAVPVLMRVRRLPPPVLRVLAACAATGGAPAGTVVELSNTDCAAVVAATEEAVVAWEDEQLVVAHPLLGAAALKAIGLRARLELHARAADVAVCPAERARQLDQAALPGPDDTIAAALAAASERAWAAGATAPALAHASRALARTARDSAERARRAVMLAEAAVASGWFDRAAAVLAGLDLFRLELSLLDRALPLLVTALTAEGGDQLVAKTLAGLAARAGAGSVRWAMIDVRRLSGGEPVPDRARRACQALELMAGAQTLPRAQHRALTLLLIAGLDAGEGLDRAVLTRMRALERRIPALPLLDTADAVEAVHAYQVGELAVSRGQLIGLVNRAEEMGETATAEVFRLHLAYVEVMSGHPAAGAALLQWSEGVRARAGALSPVIVRAQGSLALVRGDHVAMEAVLASPCGPANTQCQRVSRLAMRGAWAAAHERWADALPPLSEALKLSAEQGVDEPGRRLWLDTILGTGLVASDRLAEAEQIAARLEGMATAAQRPLVRGHGLRLRGLVSAASGDLATAQERLSQAARLIGQSEMPGDYARCLLELGRVLRRRRARKEGRRVLLEALAVAERIGDRPLRALLERELTGAGRSGEPDALTPAEHRVAVAAAQGLSNREIAGACFVTVRTVETQLTSVYRKLGVRSRSQLAARLPTAPAGSDGGDDLLPQPPAVGASAGALFGAMP